MEDIQISAIRKRITQVHEQIAAAAIRSGRAPEAVQLVTVTKSQPVDVVRAVIAAGAMILGENYAEEAVTKMTELTGTTADWHMIGHVQSRKAGLVADNFKMVQSLDSVKLAVKLDRVCSERKGILPVLLEINTSGEADKFGLPAWDEEQWMHLEPVVEEIVGLTHIQVHGLMTMPPFTSDPEQARSYFQRLRRLQAYFFRLFPQTDWSELSMGTSGDFVVAVEEGATFVRVGRTILGERQVQRIHA